MLQALAGLRSGLYSTPYKAAKKTGASKSTLLRRLKGGRTRPEAREGQQLLSEAQEKTLVSWISNLTATGHPAHHDFIREMAEEIRKSSPLIHDAQRRLPIGETWVRQFIKRHPYLKTTLSRSIELARVKDITANMVRDWFEKFQAALEEHQITMENVYNMDETGATDNADSTNIGFAIGTGQTSFVVVDSRLRRKYQAEPGRQEWVTVLECNSPDGNAIPPLVIFKGENLSLSWIPREVQKEWHFSCNSKGYTSNMHGEEWLVKCFDPVTRIKANGRKRMLLCDGHDSHISAQFVRFCIDHDIILFLLLPHSSHLLQPLDVGIFSPLKKAMSSQLSRLYATEISRLHKAEWLEYYMRARSIAITPKNICSSWRGAGLFPMNVNRILRLLPDDAEASPSPPPEDMDEAAPLLVTSSPPDGTVLRNANATFKQVLSNTALASPIRKHARRLSSVAEKLHAQNSILSHENAELKQLINKRKERMSGKRLVLKGKFVVSTEEVYQKLMEAERATKERKKKTPKRKRQGASIGTEVDEEVIEENADDELEEIGDCIEVHLSRSPVRRF